MVANKFHVISPSPTSKENTNINYELQYTRWLLSFFGVWPMVTGSMTKSTIISSIIIIIINMCSILFTLIPCTMFMLFKTKTFKQRLAFFGPLGFRIANIMKYILLMYRSGIIRECIDYVKSDWFEVTHSNDRYAMLKSISLGRSLTNICVTFMISSGVFFHIAGPLLKPRKLNAYNETIRPHVYPGYDFFVHSQATPAYEIIFIGHFLFANVGYLNQTTMCALASTFVSHICGQVEVLRLKLDRLDSDNDKDVQKQIASVVRCHMRILRLSESVKVLFREICLIDIFFSSIVVCWTEFYAITEWHNSVAITLVSYFVLCLSHTFNIFVYCFIGQILTDQCESISCMAYMIKWHQISTENILSLIMIISMARLPQKLSAGGLMDLSIRSFGDIMKTTLAYLNMLRIVLGA